MSFRTQKTSNLAAELPDLLFNQPLRFYTIYMPRELFKRETASSKGQLKEQAGFLVSRSLTLPSAPP